MVEVVVHLRVTPGSSRPRIGGRWGEQVPPRLIVAVRARAVDGAANREVVDAVARAWDLPRRAVRLVAGERSRSKTVAVEGVEQAIRDRFDQLLDEA